MSVRLRLADRWPRRDEAKPVEPLPEFLAAPDPTECPICFAKPPFDHLKDGEHHLCKRCGFAFAVDEKGELIKFWATNKSRPEGL